MDRKREIAVLTSGGLDSAILIDELSKKFSSVHPLYFESGYVWEKAELYWLKKFLDRLKNRRVKSLTRFSGSIGTLYQDHWSFTGKHIPGAASQDKSVYLPGKNILLIAYGSIFCALKKIRNLALGPLGTNPFPDAAPSFLKNIQKTCSQGLDFPVKIHTPFLTQTKKEVMKLGWKLPLGLTFSCLNPKKWLHCGRCNKCAERKKAFRDAGLIDPTSYA